MAYNGWKNKETWLVDLWLGDMLTMDQETGNEITADYIEMLVEDMVDGALDRGARSFSGFVIDVLNCALGEIDYHELASHYEEEENA
jgi:hypothetical protein